MPDYDFTDEPDYVLRWPPTLFTREARRLAAAAYTMPADDWERAVQLLLRQAFEGSVPTDDFQQVLLSADQPLQFDDEPF